MKVGMSCLMVEIYERRRDDKSKDASSEEGERTHLFRIDSLPAPFQLLSFNLPCWFLYETGESEPVVELELLEVCEGEEEEGRERWRGGGEGGVDLVRKTTKGTVSLQICRDVARIRVVEAPKVGGGKRTRERGGCC